MLEVEGCNINEGSTFSLVRVWWGNLNMLDGSPDDGMNKVQINAVFG